MIQAGTYVVDDTTLYHSPITSYNFPFINFLENQDQPETSMYHWRKVTDTEEIDAVDYFVEDFSLHDGEYAVFGPPANPQLLFEGR
jgi:hypothetical protein